MPGTLPNTGHLHLVKLSSARDVQSKNVKIWWKRLTRSSSSITQCNCFSGIFNICITLFRYHNGKNCYVLSSEHIVLTTSRNINSTMISWFFSQKKIHFCSHTIPLLVSSYIHLLTWLPSQIHVPQVFTIECLILAQIYLFLDYKSFTAKAVQVCQE